MAVEAPSRPFPRRRGRGERAGVSEQEAHEPQAHEIVFVGRGSWPGDETKNNRIRIIAGEGVLLDDSDTEPGGAMEWVICL